MPEIQNNKELNQGRRQGQRERHLQIHVRVFQLFQDMITPVKCSLSILELNWNNLKIYCHPYDCN